MVGESESDTSYMPLLNVRPNLPFMFCVVVFSKLRIALEAVYALRHLSDIQVFWIIRNRSLGAPYFDEAASAFLVPLLFPEKDPDVEITPSNAGVVIESSIPCDSPELDAQSSQHRAVLGSAAIGWHRRLGSIQGDAGLDSASPTRSSVQIRFAVEVSQIHQNPDGDGVNIKLSSGETLSEIQVVLAATGVRPNTDMLRSSPVLLKQQIHAESRVLIILLCTDSSE